MRTGRRAHKATLGILANRVAALTVVHFKRVGSDIYSVATRLQTDRQTGWSVAVVGEETSLRLDSNMWKLVYVVAVLAVLFVMFRNRAELIR